MRGVNVHMNVSFSGTKLTLGLRVGFISSHLTVDKLFPVNLRAITVPPKMSLLFEAKSMLALIIKPRLILAAHTDDLGWNKMSNQRQQMLIQNLNRILSADQMLHQGRSCIALQTVFQLTLCLRKTFLLTHKFGTACAIEMTADRGVIRVTYECYNRTLY